MNTSNIVFLKSTDDSMLDTLQKMSGTTHRTYIDSKTITRDIERIWMRNEGKASYTSNTREQPVISYNDMAFIPERNSIIFRAGDSPIWNRNETILPMSWRLFGGSADSTIVAPGKTFSLQTIPTLSSAVDFDVRKNQPDFHAMLDKRMKQAQAVSQAKMAYQSVYEYSDYEIEQLDPDTYSDAIMEIVNTSLNESSDEGFHEDWDDIDTTPDWEDDVEVNTEVKTATAQAQAELASAQRKIYAGGVLSKDDLVSKLTKNACHNYDSEIAAVYADIKGDLWQDKMYFKTYGDGNLYGVDGTPYIVKQNESENLQMINCAAKSADSNVFADHDIEMSEVNALGQYMITDAFLKFLVSFDAWTFANGKFEEAMRRQCMG